MNESCTNNGQIYSGTYVRANNHWSFNLKKKKEFCVAWSLECANILETLVASRLSLEKLRAREAERERDDKTLQVLRNTSWVNATFIKE